MTDNEIIKCLRRCRAGDCEECKALGVCNATFSFHKNALDLINRQQAEIERLKKELMQRKLEKEMTASINKIEHNSLCETETYKGGE